MKKTIQITKKIWLSTGIIISGYLLTMTIGFFSNQQMEKKLFRISESMFPAAQYSQVAVSEYKQQAKHYYDAVSLGEESFIKSAREKARNVTGILHKIEEIDNLAKERKNTIIQLIKRLEKYNMQADEIYSAMILPIGSSHSEKVHKLIPSTKEEIMNKASTLNQLAAELEMSLDFSSGKFAADLKKELFSINRFAKRWQYLNMVVFFVVIISSFSLVYIIISRFIKQPLQKTILLENVVRQSFDGIAVANMNGIVEFANHAWAHMHGYETNEIQGKHISTFVTDDSDEQQFSSFLKQVREKGFNTTEAEHVTQDGTIFPATMTTNLLKDNSGNPINMISIARDLTKEKQTEMEYLIASVSSLFFNRSGAEIQSGIEEAVQMLYQYFHDNRCAVFQLSRDGKTLSMTHECCAPNINPLKPKFQNIPAALIPWGLAKPDHTEHIVVSTLENIEDKSSELKDYLEKENSQTLIIGQMIHNNQLIGVVSINSTHPTQKWEKQHVHLIKAVSEILANVCARQRAEEAVGVYQEKLRQASSELVLTEERERRRLAGELHDRIGYALANAKIKLNLLKETSLSKEVGMAIKEVYQLVEQTIQDTRSLTFEISPPLLYELGFEAAIDWLTEQLQKHHGIQTTFQDDMQPKPVDDIIRVLIFQSVRELLFNMIKHSQATRATVAVSRIENQIQVRVQDNGIGFDSKKTGSIEGFGLFSIRERLKQLGGKFHLTSQPQKGTSIQMHFPMQRIKV